MASNVHLTVIDIAFKHFNGRIPTQHWLKSDLLLRLERLGSRMRETSNRLTLTTNFNGLDGTLKSKHQNAK